MNRFRSARRRTSSVLGRADIVHLRPVASAGIAGLALVGGFLLSGLGDGLPGYVLAICLGLAFVGGCAVGYAYDRAAGWSRPAKNLTVLGGAALVVVPGLLALALPFGEQESQVDAYEMVSKLSAGRALSSFIEILGPPDDENFLGEEYKYSMFDESDFVVRVASNARGDVVAFIVTACASDFRPSFEVPGRPQEGATSGATITLNETNLLEAGGESPQRVSYNFGASGVVYQFFEAQYLGGPGAYQTAHWGVDAFCSNNADLGDMSVLSADLNELDAQAVGESPDVQEWRKTVVVRSYGVNVSIVGGDSYENPLLEGYR